MTSEAIALARNTINEAAHLLHHRQQLPVER